MALVRGAGYYARLMGPSEPPPNADRKPESGPDAASTVTSIPDSADSSERSAFWPSLAVFLGPIMFLALGSTAGMAFQWLWALAFLLLLIAFVGAILLHATRHGDAGNGAFAALGLGVLILLGTCVYNLGVHS